MQICGGNEKKGLEEEKSFIKLKDCDLKAAWRRNPEVKMWLLQKKVIVQFIRRKIENGKRTIEEVCTELDNHGSSLDGLRKKISS